MPKGPTLHFYASCEGCDYKTNEYVSGVDHYYCTHPSLTRRFLATYSKETPDWCPAQPETLTALKTLQCLNPQPAPLEATG